MMQSTILMRLLIASMLLLNFCVSEAQSDEQVMKRIYEVQLTSSPVYENLRYLTKHIGPRISSSSNLAEAIDFVRGLMLSYGFDTVYMQPVMVPNWRRGENEVLRISGTSENEDMNLSCLALGNSIATGEGGLSGGVVEIYGMEELKKADKGQIEGKIVFLNEPMDNSFINTSDAYHEVSDQRDYGATEASAKGATGLIIRSLSIDIDEYPHTGYSEYKNGIKKIPAVAISTKDADLLSARLERNPETEIYMELHCETLDSTLSYNVVGELSGSVDPDEIIAVGAHIDSWDVGEGAHDDGGACLQAIEVIRTFKSLGINPKHKIRVVMWTDEENGWGGNIQYAKQSTMNHEMHIAAIEADYGAYTPIGFFIDTDNESALYNVLSWKHLFEPYWVTHFLQGHPGTDIVPLKNSNILLLGLMTDNQKYFTIHHSERDVFEEVNKRELELGAAALTSMVYLIDKYGLE